MTRACLWAGVFLFVIGGGWAQETIIRVRKPPTAKMSLDLSGLKTGTTAGAVLFRRTLEADLVRSGWFTLVPAGAGAYVVSGASEEAGGNLRLTCQVLNSVTQQSKLSKAFAESADRTRVLAHRVADEIVLALSGYPGIASTRLVMVGSTANGKDIYICDGDGENLRPLTRDRAVCIAPHWSPKGDLIAYTSYRSGYNDAYLIDLNAGNWRRVSKCPGLNTSGGISPDGRDLALILSKDGNPDLYVLSLGSGKLTRLTATPHAGEASPSWSPAGNQIVFVSDSSGQRHLYCIARSGGERRRLTSRGNENLSPDWGPNGLIAYTSRREGRYHICVLNPDTLEDEQITHDLADFEDPSWAPDGRHIACSRTIGYRSAAYVLDTMGDNPVALFQSQGDWYSPAWSPK